MERLAKVLFAAVLSVMVWLTVTAGLQRGVFTALEELYGLAGCRPLVAPVGGAESTG